MVRSRHSKVRLLTLSLVLAGGATGLAGCSSASDSAAGGSSIPPSASAAESGTTAPSSPAPTATATASTTPEPSAPASAEGCAPNDTAVPAGATTAEIGDVDGDGRADQGFYTETDGFAYGIRTASGATVLQSDPLAGPGGHRGWTVAVAPGLAATVLEDGRTAALLAFTDCAFVTPTGTDGEPYTFTLAGFGDAGTGVACGPADARGDRSIVGLLAEQGDNGSYSITSTTVELSADGRTATNGAVTSAGESLAADDPVVAAAMTATCDGVASVGTSGM